MDWFPYVFITQKSNKMAAQTTTQNKNNTPKDNNLNKPAGPGAVPFMRTIV